MFVVTIHFTTISNKPAFDELDDAWFELFFDLRNRIVSGNTNMLESEILQVKFPTWFQAKPLVQKSIHSLRRCRSKTQEKVEAKRLGVSVVHRPKDNAIPSEARSRQIGLIIIVIIVIVVVVAKLNMLEDVKRLGAPPLLLAIAKGVLVI